MNEYEKNDQDLKIIFLFVSVITYFKCCSVIFKYDKNMNNRDNKSYIYIIIFCTYVICTDIFYNDINYFENYPK